MGYAFRNNLAYAIVDRWTVFLDIAADRYWCLGSRAGRTLTKLAADETIDSADDAALCVLLGKGLLDAQSSASAIPWPVSIEILGDLSGSNGSSARLPDLLGALWHVACQRIFFRSTPLRTAIRDLATRKSCCVLAAANKHETAVRIATAFSHISIVLGSHDRCLPRSFALVRHLAAERIPSQLVFGVAMDPFMAHCWVQHDGVILNDRVDHVRTFTPIFVI